MRFCHTFTLFTVVTFVQLSLVCGQFDDEPLKKPSLLVNMLDPLYDNTFRKSLSNLQDVSSYMDDKSRRMGRGLSKRGSGVVMPWRELCALANQDKDCFFRNSGR